MRKNAAIAQKTLDEISSVLAAKGLDPEKIPAGFAASSYGLESIKSLELADLTKEYQGQAILSWLNQLPDDQPPADQTPDAGEGTEPQDLDSTAGQETAPPDQEANPGPEEDDNPLAGNIRKKEENIFIKRPLTAAECVTECQESLDELFKLEARRASLETAMEGYKGQAKACQKEIETIDAKTYGIIRDLKENEIEEQVPALRVTDMTAGIITWFHRDTNEVLRTRPLEQGEPVPLDLTGEAGADPPAAEGEANSHGADVPHCCETCAKYEGEAPCIEIECSDHSAWTPEPAPGQEDRDCKTCVNFVPGAVCAADCGDDFSAWAPIPDAGPAQEGAPRTCETCGKYNGADNTVCPDCDGNYSDWTPATEASNLPAGQAGN